ncbi:MAG: thioredoxin [Deltaproteobacteria bacterium]|nr:thioredoxin [Deltaproteobacteria bacterium]
MSDIVTVSESNFDQEVIQSATPVLVDFWAPWCGPCKQIAPVIDALAEEHAGKVKFAKVNVDDNPNLAARYGVRGIPALLFFKGGQIVQQQVGAVPKQQIAAMFA